MATVKNRQRVYLVRAAIENTDRLELFLSTSEASVRLLQQMMQVGVVDFVFRKDSTSVMVRRRGTLHPDVLAFCEFSPNNTGHYRSPKLLNWFDVETSDFAHPWRSSLADNLVGYFVHDEQWSSDIIQNLLEKLQEWKGSSEEDE